MSYIVEESNNFLSSLPVRMREEYDTVLSQFNYFTTDVYNRKGQTLLDELKEQVKQDDNNEKIYIILHKFAQWLLVDHLDLQIIAGNEKCRHTRPMKKRMPVTAKMYAMKLVLYIEDTFRLELSRNTIKNRLKIPAIVEEEDPEPFTPEEVRLLIDNCPPKRKALYMVLKDSGMRIQECCSFKKKDVDTTKNPVEIHLLAKYTKTKRARTTYVSRETAPLLIKKLAKLQDEDIVFATSPTPQKSVDAEWQNFNLLRKRVGLTERYKYNGRYKKTLHSFRSYTGTQATKAVDSSWGHSLLGHKQYLGQYIRNQDDYPKFYKRTESHLMIYEKIEVVDQTISIEEMKIQLKEEFRREREEFMRLLSQRDSISAVIEK
jgi:integrase